MNIYIPILILLLAGCSTPSLTKKLHNQQERLSTIAYVAKDAVKVDDIQVQTKESLNTIIDLAGTPANIIKEDLKDIVVNLNAEKLDIEERLEAENIKLLAKVEASDLILDSASKSISHGFSILMKRLAYIVGGIGALLLILKLSAPTSLITTVCGKAIGAIINLISRLIPNISSHTREYKERANEHDIDWNTLTRIVRTIHYSSEATTLKELKVILNVELDSQEKQIVSEIKNNKTI